MKNKNGSIKIHLIFINQLIKYYILYNSMSTVQYRIF